MQSLKLGYYISILSHSVFPQSFHYLSSLSLFHSHCIPTSYHPFLGAYLTLGLCQYSPWVSSSSQLPPFLSSTKLIIVPLYNLLLSVTESINSPANLKYLHVKLLIFQPNLFSPDLEQSISFPTRPIFSLLPPCLQYLFLLLCFNSHHLSHLKGPNCFLLSHIFQPTFRTNSKFTTTTQSLSCTVISPIGHDLPNLKFNYYVFLHCTLIIPHFLFFAHSTNYMLPVNREHIFSFPSFYPKQSLTCNKF